MAIYLAENEVGTDADLIGYPALGACMAMALQTEQGLCGWHIYGTGRIDLLGPLYRQFRDQSGPGGENVRLYGTCHRGKRYTHTEGAWRTEMTKVAELLGYTGVVSGFDLSRTANPVDAIHVEYRRVIGGCSIHYKRVPKMQFTKGTVTEADPIKKIRPAPNREVDTDDYVLAYPYKGGVTVAARVVATYWNKGEMHQVDNAMIESFRV